MINLYSECLIVLFSEKKGGEEIFCAIYRSPATYLPGYHCSLPYVLSNQITKVKGYKIFLQLKQNNFVLCKQN